MLVLDVDDDPSAAAANLLLRVTLGVAHGLQEFVGLALQGSHIAVGRGELLVVVGDGVGRQVADLAQALQLRSGRIKALQGGLQFALHGRTAGFAALEGRLRLHDAALQVREEAHDISWMQGWLHAHSTYVLARPLLNC